MLRSFACAFALSIAPLSGIAAPCADVALVLAIDTSGSIDADEFALQARGLFGAAFRDPSVQRAVDAAGVVDVAAVFWADPGARPQLIAWHRLAKPGDAADFAAVIGGTRRSVGGDTGLGQGVAAALLLLKIHPGCASRAIINVSGDGRASNGPSRDGDRVLAAARRAAADVGVTINALAIAGAEDGLAGYFRTSLATGPDSFVMEVADFSGFGEAIVRKLVREIPSATRGIARPLTRAICLPLEGGFA